MATRIRLKRLGRKNRPFYRIIVIDSRKRRDGAAIEEVGWYDPILNNDKNYILQEDRILHWLSQGAQPSDVVKNMMTKTGLSHRWHLMKLGLSGDEIEKNMQKWQLDRELTLRQRSEKALEKSALQNKEAEKEKELGEEVKVAIKSESEESDYQEAKSRGLTEELTESHTEDSQDEEGEGAEAEDSENDEESTDESEDEVSKDESETDTGDSSDTDDGTADEDSENENIDEESKPKNDFTEQTDDVDLEDEVSKEGSDNADVESETVGETATDSDDSSESKNRKKEK